MEWRIATVVTQDLAHTVLIFKSTHPKEAQDHQKQWKNTDKKWKTWFVNKSLGVQ